MVQQTSLVAYLEILDMLSRKQKLVLKAIKRLSHPNNKQLADYLQLPINSITPRVFELRKLGLVSQGGTKPCIFTGRKTIWWKAI